VLLAPVSHHALVHPDGEIATARAADAQETGMIVSTLSSVPLERVAAELRRNRWFQLYFQSDWRATASLVTRATDAGYGAIVVTVDAPVSGMRNRAERAGFRLPPEVRSANLEFGEPAPPPLAPGASRVFQGAMAHAPTWDDVRRLRTHTRLPLLLKGIMHPDDARRARDVGVDGIVVSNHGGRALDEAPAPLEVLTSIRAAVGPTVMLLVDGGIRRGGDVFVALALGADAVLIGRPQLYALAVDGAIGVARMLRLIRDELELTMALAGCPTVADIDVSCLLNVPAQVRGS
jgi:isopentenyl diphosphate isomerase/L-lactate dehydrogenase-like FMN-dependent dehydrogenase